MIMMLSTIMTAILALPPRLSPTPPSIKVFNEQFNLDAKAAQLRDALMERNTLWKSWVSQHPEATAEYQGWLSLTRLFISVVLPSVVFDQVFVPTSVAKARFEVVKKVVTQHLLIPIGNEKLI